MNAAVESSESEMKLRGRPPKAENTEVAKPMKMYKVTIHSGEDKGEKGDVFLSHNGNAILIQRDKEVIISDRHLECLNHSVIETMVRGEDRVERPVKIPRFAYNVSPA